MVTGIAGMGLVDNQVNQCIATQFFSQFPSLLFVFPHQRGDDVQSGIHTGIQCNLQSLDGIIPAVWIAGKIRFTHSADQDIDAAAVSNNGGSCQEHQVASWDKCVWQAVFHHLDFDILGHCRFRKLTEQG